MRFNEVIQQLSEDFDPIKRQHLDDLISQYRDATDPIGYDDDARDPDEVIAQIRQEFGDKIANDLEQGPSSHFPRDNHSMGYDSLKHSGSPRVTKSGKVNRQDVSALKGRLQQRAGSHTEPTLPESEDRSRFIRHNIWTVMDSDEEVMQHPVEGDPFFSAKKFIRDLDDQGYEFTHVISPEGKITYLPQHDPRHLSNEGVAEASQRVDSLVTDALKIMRGSGLNDAVQALKTVLGNREYNDRRGHYNFYVRQLMDMYSQQGSLKEFAPGNSGGESGRWYTDDQMTDLVGDGWWNDLDISGEVSKQEMIQEAQAWLDDQGYSVHVLNCKVNDDDMEWFIEGSFQNSNFAKKGVAEGEGDLATALSKLSGSWSGWHKEEDMSSPDVDVYEYDDGEGGYYGRGTIEHNLKTGTVKVEYHDSENEADVVGTFKNMGDAMRALRGGGGNHGGKAPNFDRLGQRKQHGPDDLRKTDRTGRKGTLAGGPTNSLKQAIQWNKGKHGPKGTLPESEEEKKSFKVTYTNPKTEENKVVKIKAHNKDEVLDYCVSKGYNDVSVKEMASEGYRVVPGYDKEKYQERPGLEGPFHTKSGKVVYYDKKEGSYYDPDSDMYISYEDWNAMNEAGFGRATGRASWDSNMPGYQGDYGGAENWGRREREDDEHHEIDRRQEQQAASGTWYITKDGKLVKDKEGQPYQFVGKAAATKAAQTMMAKPFNQGKKFMLTTKGA